MLQSVRRPLVFQPLPAESPDNDRGFEEGLDQLFQSFLQCNEQGMTAYQTWPEPIGMNTVQVPYGQVVAEP